MKYGPQVEKLGYPADGIFEYHGRSHILRVLALSLIYFYNSGDDLTERDKNILIYFALLHDVGRTDDEADHRHGKVSVERIEREGIEIDGLAIWTDWTVCGLTGWISLCCVRRMRKNCR